MPLVRLICYQFGYRPFDCRDRPDVTVGGRGYGEGFGSTLPFDEILGPPVDIECADGFADKLGPPFVVDCLFQAFATEGSDIQRVGSSGNGAVAYLGKCAFGFLLIACHRVAFRQVEQRLRIAKDRHPVQIARPVGELL